MRYLNDKGQQALQLADHLQKAQWLSHCGLEQSFTVSPFIDPTGQPAVIVKMNAHMACTLIDSLNEQQARATRQPALEGMSAAPPGPI
jgi:hypothetical protein